MKKNQKYCWMKYDDGMMDDDIIIQFPSTCNCNAPTRSFYDVCTLALQEVVVESEQRQTQKQQKQQQQQQQQQQRPIIIIELHDDVIIDKTIILKKRQHLILRGCSSSCLDSNDQSNNNNKTPQQQHRRKKRSLSGNVHSLFLLNNQSRLTIENLHLNHTLESKNDHRQIGAVINLRYKSIVNITDSVLHSRAGFCCWLVQKSCLQISNSILLAPIRSAIVCFGQSQCFVNQITIDNAGVHGICARGVCQLNLNQCHINQSCSRAIYAYAGTKVTMTDCIVSNTINPTKAAIEISSSSSSTGEKGEGGVNNNASNRNSNSSNSSLTITNCTVVDNGGAGICLRGSPAFQMKGNGNIVERNAGGNIIQRDSIINDDENDNVDNDNNNSNTLPQHYHHQQQQHDNIIVVQRDSPNTSFRQGDWWCPKCPMYVLLDRQSNCPKCHSTKSDGGRYLTILEINQCNQGIYNNLKKTKTETTENTTTITTTTIISSSSNSITKTTSSSSENNNQHNCRKNSAVEVEVVAVWSYDADDKGWIQYDDRSQRLLEDAYQQYHNNIIIDHGSNSRKITIINGGDDDDCNNKNNDKNNNNNGSKSDTIPPPTTTTVYPIILLSNGTYQVNIDTMEQINVHSQFMRLVRRRCRTPPMMMKTTATTTTNDDDKYKTNTKVV